jgi:hypothetical protein
MGESRMPDEFFTPRQTQPEHPTFDQKPSPFPMVILQEGRMLRFRLDVLGEGTMEMLVDGDPKTGRLIYRGMRLVVAK